MATPGPVLRAAPAPPKPAVVVENVDGRTKTLDSNTGIQVVKGGQTIDLSLVDSVTAAYANLVNSPVVLTALTVLLVCGLAEWNNSHGPFEMLQDALNAIIASADESVFIKNVAYVLLFFVNIIVKYKIRVIAIGLFWVPYFAKPSSNNMKLSILLSIFVFFRPADLASDLVLSQLYFIYTQVRTPRVRLIIMIVSLVVFVIGFATLKTAVTGPGLRVVSPPGTGGSYKLRGSPSGAPVSTTKDEVLEHIEEVIATPAVSPPPVR